MSNVLVKLIKREGLKLIVEFKASEEEVVSSPPVSVVDPVTEPLSTTLILFLGLKFKFQFADFDVVFVPVLFAILPLKPVPRSTPWYSLKNVLKFAEFDSERISPSSLVSNRVNESDPLIVSMGFVLNEAV